MGKTIDLAAVAPPPPPAVEALHTETEDELPCNRFKAKGCTLAWAMRTDDRAVGRFYELARRTAASPFNTEDDLWNWYWYTLPNEEIGGNDMWGLHHT
jgi:hypothetical protein